MSSITELTQDRQRNKSVSPSVRDNCHLCVKFSSQRDQIGTKHLFKSSKHGSFENEALENEDRSTKHPNLENEDPKSRKRSTQNSKTKTPNLENEAPYLEKEAPKSLCPL